MRLGKIQISQIKSLVIQTAPDFKGFPENEWDKKFSPLAAK
jgi:hypothetical protein